MFWLKMIIATIALVLILIGIWHEEKLIAFEDKCVDILARGCAKIIIFKRRVCRKIKSLKGKEI